MVLNAIRQTGSASSGRRLVRRSVRGTSPSTGGTSSGLGKYATTPSSSAGMPLSLSAAPHSTGVICIEMQPERTAARRSSGEIGSSSTNRSSSFSSNSAAVSQSSWRCSSYSSFMSSGSGISLTTFPLSSSNSKALPVIRSM